MSPMAGVLEFDGRCSHRRKRRRCCGVEEGREGEERRTAEGGGEADCEVKIGAGGPWKTSTGGTRCEGMGIFIIKRAKANEKHQGGGSRGRGKRSESAAEHGTGERASGRDRSQPTGADGATPRSEKEGGGMRNTKDPKGSSRRGRPEPLERRPRWEWAGLSLPAWTTPGERAPGQTKGKPGRITDGAVEHLIPGGLARKWGQALPPGPSRGRRAASGDSQPSGALREARRGPRCSEPGHGWMRRAPPAASARPTRESDEPTRGEEEVEKTEKCPIGDATSSLNPCQAPRLRDERLDEESRRPVPHFEFHTLSAAVGAGPACGPCIAGLGLSRKGAPPDDAALETRLAPREMTVG